MDDNNQIKDNNVTEETTKKVETTDTLESHDTTPKNEMTLEDYKSALSDARKEAAKYRTERNDLRADAEKYREIEEAKLSDIEKLQKQIKDTEDAKADLARQNSELEAQLKKNSVAIKYGISQENMSLLGDNPENFESNAKRLQELQDLQDKRDPIPNKTPQENLRSGASSEEEKEYSYPSSWIVPNRK